MEEGRVKMEEGKKKKKNGMWAVSEGKERSRALFLGQRGQSQ